MSWKALAFGGADAAAAAGPSLDSNLDQYGDVIGTFGEDGTFVQDNRARADAAAAAEPEPEFVPLQMALAQVVDYLKERLLSGVGVADEEDSDEEGGGAGVTADDGDGGGDRKPLTMEDILDGTGIDLVEREDVVAQLKKNKNVIVTSVDPDAEAADGGDIAAAAHAAAKSKHSIPGRRVELFRYKPKANVKNIRELERLVNRCPNGLPVLEIDDAYAGVTDDWQKLVHDGRVIGVKSAETNNVVMFPRGPSFLTQLSCPVWVDGGVSRISTSGRDVTAEIRRGDALVLDGGTYRVAYETKGTKNPSVLSVSSNKELSARARWAADFDDPAGGVPLSLPFEFNKATGGEGEAQPIGTKRQRACLAAAASSSSSKSKGGAGVKLTAYKHGVSNDIRQMWKATVAGWPADERLLNKEMLRNGLMTQEQYNQIVNPVNKRHLKGNASMHKVKKRRYRKKKVKISTNSHLHGTEVGREIERQSHLMAGEGRK